MGFSYQAGLFSSDSKIDIDNKIVKMPKVDLHRHMLGSINISQFINISKKLGVPLPSNEDYQLKSLLTVQTPVDGLSNFFKPWRYYSRLLKSPHAVYLIARDVIGEAAKDNIIYLELRVSWGMTGREKFGVDAFLASLKDAIEECEKEHGIICKIILGINRHLFARLDIRTRDSLFNTLKESALNYSNDIVVGFDLSGLENRFPPILFEKYFKQLIAEGFKITIHAGETTGPQGIWEAVKNIRANRISHGLSAVADKNLIEYLRSNKICLEICPTSNLLTSVVVNLEEHPLRTMISEGLNVTINTDNPAICNVTLSEEYQKIIDTFGISLADLIQFNLCAINCSFASIDVKQKLYSIINQYGEETGYERSTKRRL